MAKRMCIAEDDGERCSRDAVVRDMCVKHYQRWRMHWDATLTGWNKA